MRMRSEGSQEGPAGARSNAGSRIAYCVSRHENVEVAMACHDSEEAVATPTPTLRACNETESRRST